LSGDAENENVKPPGGVRGVRRPKGVMGETTDQECEFRRTGTKEALVKRMAKLTWQGAMEIEGNTGDGPGWPTAATDKRLLRALRAPRSGAGGKMEVPEHFLGSPGGKTRKKSQKQSNR